MRKLASPSIVLWIIGFSLTICSCSSSEAASHQEIQLADLPCQTTNPNQVWQSTSWSSDNAACGWVSFPAEGSLTFNHPLGTTPTILLPYIAFAPDGVAATLASGDLAIVDQIDATSVRITNRTAEDFFLRLVLQ